MGSVFRVDVGTIRSPERLPNGFLRVDASATRSGVLLYRGPNGEVIREWRPPDEVFKADSLASLALVPVTDDHPPGLLTAKNAKEFTRGSVGETPRRDGNLVVAPLMVTDAGLIEKMDAGQARQCSPGYLCDLEHTAGVTPEGERYDAIQRNIRYNHLAVLPRGRSGDAVRVHMDGEDQSVILIQGTEARDHRADFEEKPNVKTLRIDGIDYPADSDAAVQAIARLQEKQDAAVKAAEAKAAEAAKVAEQTQAKLDAAQGEAKELKAKLDAAPKAIRAELAARAALEGKARQVLGSKFKLDGLDDTAVRVAVIQKIAGEKFKADGRSADYIAARFDAEIERFDGETVAAETTETEGERADAGEREEHLDADDLKAKFIAHTEKQWQGKIPGAISVEK